MKPQPFYTPSSVPRCAYSLRYCWTGWPSTGEFPVPLGDLEQSDLNEKWEKDGLRLLEKEWSGECIRLLFSVKPQVTPILFSSRVKGRLQHALRLAGNPTKFSRKVSFRTLGENSTAQVEAYIKTQVQKEKFVDSKFAERIQRYTSFDTNLNLDAPIKTRSGRYWYNLHLVLVNDNRVKITSEDHLQSIYQCIDAIALRKQHSISVKSLMPDHLHMALRGNINSSPEDIALEYMNNLSYTAGSPIFKPSYYVGTFGVFDLNAIRTRLG